MGQPITVVEKRSRRPGIVRYEINRSITGMDHEVYDRGQTITGNRPPDELARRLLGRGDIDRVSINSSVVTVMLARGAEPSGLLDTIRDLFRFYPDVVAGAEAAVGDEPAAGSEPAGTEPAGSAPAGAADAEAGPEPEPAGSGA